MAIGFRFQSNLLSIIVELGPVLVTVGRYSSLQVNESIRWVTEQIRIILVISKFALRQISDYGNAIYYNQQHRPDLN